jgi:hypothetical protein
MVWFVGINGTYSVLYTIPKKKKEKRKKCDRPSTMYSTYVAGASGPGRRERETRKERGGGGGKREAG